MRMMMTCHNKVTKYKRTLKVIKNYKNPKKKIPKQLGILKMRCKTILYEQKCEKLGELTSNDKELETWSA